MGKAAFLFVGYVGWIDEDRDNLMDSLIFFFVFCFSSS